VPGTPPRHGAAKQVETRGARRSRPRRGETGAQAPCPSQLRLISGRGEGEENQAARPRNDKLVCGAQMPIGLLTLEIHIPDARSLKDKRQVIRSLKDRLRANFNVAVAELDHQDLWQRSRVGIVSISGDGRHLEDSLQAIAQESERVLGRDLVSQQIEYFEDGE